MILSYEQILTAFPNEDEDAVKQKLKALECNIRAYTNNNFQNRNVRFRARIEGGKIKGLSPFLRVGDSIEISQSAVNDGVYEVLEISDSITVDGELFDVPSNLITKVEYPADVKQGVINLLKWEIGNRDKVGIKSETLSRHSVTYYDQDTNNTVMGYPVSLMGFLKPYMKARF